MYKSNKKDTIEEGTRLEHQKDLMVALIELSKEKGHLTTEDLLKHKGSIDKTYEKTKEQEKMGSDYHDPILDAPDEVDPNMPTPKVNKSFPNWPLSPKENSAQTEKPKMEAKGTQKNSSMPGLNKIKQTFQSNMAGKIPKMEKGVRTEWVDKGTDRNAASLGKKK